MPTLPRQVRSPSGLDISWEMAATKTAKAASLTRRLIRRIMTTPLSPLLCPEAGPLPVAEGQPDRMRGDARQPPALAALAYPRTLRQALAASPDGEHPPHRPRHRLSPPRHLR